MEAAITLDDAIIAGVLIVLAAMVIHIFLDIRQRDKDGE